MRKVMANQGPPEKRRKTETTCDDLWDDDSEIFSQAVLHDIDEIIQSQQAPKESNNNGAKPDSMGVVRSGSTGKVIQLSMESKSQGYHTLNGQSTQGTLRCGQKTASYQSQLRLRSQSKSIEPKPSLQSCPPPHTSNVCVSANQIAPSTTSTLTACHKQPYSKTVMQSTSSSGNQFTLAMKQKLTTSEEENHFLKEENQKLKGAQYGKDGQIKYLRTKLAQLESEKFKDRQEKQQRLEQQKRDQNEREKRLEKEVDKTKTMLQFKEHELDEMKERCRRHEKQLRSDGSPVRANFQSPSRSPRARPQSPRTPSKGGQQFPTKNTFMKEECSPRKEKQVKAGVDEGTQMCTQTSLAAPERPVRMRRMNLHLTHGRGRVSGPQLVNKLIECSAPTHNTHTANDLKSTHGALNSNHGVFSLLQEPIQPMDLTGLKLERDPNTFIFKASSTPKTPVAPMDTSVLDESPPQHDTSLAQLSISHLLKQKGSQRDNIPSLSPRLTPHCPTPQAVYLLPILEEHLDVYIDMLLSVNKANISHSGTDSTLSGNRVESVPSSTGGLKGVSVRGATYVNSIESRTLCALKVLHQLVSYSAHVRLVLLRDKQWARDVLDAGADSQTEQGAGEATNKHNLHSQSHKNDCTPDMSQLDSTARHVAKECDVFNKLLQLANPIQSNGSLGNIWVTCYAMQVLAILTQSAPSNNNRFLPLFTQDSLFNCFNERSLLNDDGELVAVQPAVALVTAAIQFMTSVIESSDHYLEHICSKDDGCLLLCLYHFCIHTMKPLDAHTRVHLCTQVYRLLALLLSQHQAAALLFNRHCHCSTEIIKCLVLTLSRELHMERCSRVISPSHHVCSARPVLPIGHVSSHFVSFFYQGLLLLHALTLRDGLFTSHQQDGCKHEFVQLMCDVLRLLKALPDSPNKHIMLAIIPDLWDLDMEYPDSSEQDLDPQLFNKMDIAHCSTPKTTRKLNHLMY